MTTRQNVAAVSSLLLALFSASVSATPDGQESYTHFRCAGCHGDDGRGSAADPKASHIAGMASGTALVALEKMIAKGGHEDNLGGSCAETPNHAQMQAIADYVAALPR